ncbi:nucleoside diphosphate-linked moiety X motif 19-like [Oncorhynchus tshawytscha]|uniref:Acyl-coenzyme A diphosphatase NUDT19 n=1 Tax=Oncorhynchus tshawytscha TaxID=74940 RepID=A0AAZ3RHG6_ONCTS|nr:nucleoside diphosphate-linked moiety X motif 19-like [Oncorhynchus tshawytscha]
MNTALRHWKEAATVILAAGTRHKLPVDSLTRCVDKGTSAPVISEHSNLPDRSVFDYEVLLLKRSGTSGFMPNAYVFPGGLLDPSDFSSEWFDLFQSFRRSPNFGLGFVKQPPETRPPIFATDRKKLGSLVPGDVAFRICAVRETFEESGVLLVVSKGEESTLFNSIENNRYSQPELTRITDLCDMSELAKWRVLVNEKPSNFIRMCRELECLPNIWALHEWGNWLTPTGVYGKQRRYDTAFYMCCLQETPPHTLQDEKEIVHFKWSTPPEILHSYQAREMWIAPPQFYDLSRMCRFPSLQNLHSFSRQRASEGCEQWLPVRMVSDSYYISLLPGDEMYPEEGSCQMDVTLKTDQSLNELHQGCSALHRIVALDPYTAAAVITITPKYNQLLPFTRSSLRTGTSSQL